MLVRWCAACKPAMAAIEDTLGAVARPEPDIYCKGALEACTACMPALQFSAYSRLLLFTSKQTHLRLSHSWPHAC